ncbi:hypothetical protein BV22DRAFT_792471 [Leucogyrophana mollusca]|uniref:Uncharacterized protein n=1 Tax=Leucogyrophana mollusca TaxID=85980 RepID=A0ACB8B5Q7_9AGAM|nr:hypothetical protein BV22DRAFT_792471 [Leucogyrophana mollusca]
MIVRPRPAPVLVVQFALTQARSEIALPTYGLRRSWGYRLVVLPLAVDMHKSSRDRDLSKSLWTCRVKFLRIACSQKLSCSLHLRCIGGFPCLPLLRTSDEEQAKAT